MQPPEPTGRRASLARLTGRRPNPARLSADAAIDPLVPTKAPGLKPQLAEWLRSCMPWIGQPRVFGLAKPKLRADLREVLSEATRLPAGAAPNTRHMRQAEAFLHELSRIQLRALLYALNSAGTALTDLFAACSQAQKRQLFAVLDAEANTYRHLRLPLFDVRLAAELSERAIGQRPLADRLALFLLLLALRRRAAAAGRASPTDGAPRSSWQALRSLRGEVRSTDRLALQQSLAGARQGWTVAEVDAALQSYLAQRPAKPAPPRPAAGRGGRAAGAKR